MRGVWEVIFVVLDVEGLVGLFGFELGFWVWEIRL